MKRERTWERRTSTKEWKAPANQPKKDSAEIVITQHKPTLKEKKLKNQEDKLNEINRKNKKKQVNQNKGRGALEKWAPMVENHMNRRESKKKPKKEAWKKTKTKCKWIYPLQPTKICESMGNPRIREEAMEEKKED